MKVLSKMLYGSLEMDFERNLNARKYQVFSAATSDLQELVEKNILNVNYVGKSNSC